MELVALIVLLLACGAYKLIKRFVPPAPPMSHEEIKEHHKQMMNARSQAEKKAILKAMKKR